MKETLGNSKCPICNSSLWLSVSYQICTGKKCNKRRKILSFKDGVVTVGGWEKYTPIVG